MNEKRPLGLLVIWEPGPEYKIKETASFGYFQNGVDYLRTYAENAGWVKLVETGQNLKYETPTGYKVELSLTVARGIDLSLCKYLTEAVSEEVVPTTEG